MGPQTGHFEGNAPPSGRWVKDRDRVQANEFCVLTQPTTFFVIRYVRERPVISVWIRDSLSRATSNIDRVLRRYRISMNPQHVQERRPVRVGRQQTRQDRRPASDKRSSRPPDMETVGSREWRHGRPLSDTLDTNLRDR